MTVPGDQSELQHAADKYPPGQGKGREGWQQVRKAEPHRDDKHDIQQQGGRRRRPKPIHCVQHARQQGRKGHEGQIGKGDGAQRNGQGESIGIRTKSRGQHQDDKRHEGHGQHGQHQHGQDQQDRSLSPKADGAFLAVTFQPFGIDRDQGGIQRTFGK